MGRAEPDLVFLKHLQLDSSGVVGSAGGPLIASTLPTSPAVYSMERMTPPSTWMVAPVM